MISKFKLISFDYMIRNNLVDVYFIPYDLYLENEYSENEYLEKTKVVLQGKLFKEFVLNF